MAKMHTRQKRAKCLTHGHQHGSTTAKKAVGKKTFTTKEAALQYAKENKLSSEIIPAKKGKRFQLA
jgi:hypothetical protein